MRGLYKTDVLIAYLRKLRSACMRLTIRSLFKAVLRQILMPFITSHNIQA